MHYSKITVKFHNIFNTRNHMWWLNAYKDIAYYSKPNFQKVWLIIFPTQIQHDLEILDLTNKYFDL